MGLEISARWTRRAPPRFDRSRMIASVAAGAACGALLMFFLDPQRGHTRRTVARDRLEAMGRRARRRGQHLLRAMSAEARGRVVKLQHLQPEQLTPVDDETLKQRVESMLFRDPAVPKGRITLDAEWGTVTLRGALDRPDDIRSVELKTRRVPGVRAIENLLHLAGTPAPNKRDALVASHH
jgi:hypothetical protein